MKKISLIDGGPRKNMNTASLADAFADGIQETGSIEIKRVRLYELEYRGCMSCLACKLKGKSSRICLFPDDLLPFLSFSTDAFSPMLDFFLPMLLPMPYLGLVEPV